GTSHREAVALVPGGPAQEGPDPLLLRFRPLGDAVAPVAAVYGVHEVAKEVHAVADLRRQRDRGKQPHILADRKLLTFACRERASETKRGGPAFDQGEHRCKLARRASEERTVALLQVDHLVGRRERAEAGLRAADLLERYEPHNLPRSLNSDGRRLHEGGVL